MKNTKKRAYMVQGYHLTLKQIVENTSIEVIPGDGKKLYLKLDENIGLTNAETIDDELICFFPNQNSCQFLIMSTIIDAFDLDTLKCINECDDDWFSLNFDESYMPHLTDMVIVKKDIQNIVHECCFIQKRSSEIKLSEVPIKLQEFKTHFMIKGKSLPIHQIVEKTDVFVYNNDENRVCFRLGDNYGITNAKNVEDDLFYVTGPDGSDVEEMMYKIAVAFKLNVVRMKMPIASTSDKVLFDDKFFNTYGNAIIKGLDEDKVILSMRSVFTGEPEPGYFSLPVDFLGLDN